MATSKSKSASRDPDAIELLRADHRKVEKLFKEFEKANGESPDACREIVEQACMELKVHTTVEEELFYPAVREALGEDESLIDEAEVEHDSAKTLIERLEGLDPEDPYYPAAFTVLAEYVKHHVKEEESEIFPKVKKAKLDLDDLGAQMRARKEALAGEMEAAEPAEAG